VGVFSVFFLLDENVTLILCDNLLFQSINRINSACKISFDHRVMSCSTTVSTFQFMHALQNAKKNAEIEMTNSNILNKCTKIGTIH
jgi:hypothetical protein